MDLARALNLRPGEGRTLAVMSGYLFLNTATTTLLSAAKNGLFLSVYPATLIPHAVIAAALLTAVVAVVFTGIIAGTARRSLAVWLTAGLSLSLMASRWAFLSEPRSSFVLYLWLSAVQVLVITHAWDYAGDLLTGRQAKRILPLVGMGASAGAILGGASVAPAALSLGTSSLLLIGVALLVGSLPLLWGVQEPQRQEDEETVDVGAVKAFVRGAGAGFRTLASEPLLRLMAVGLVGLTLTGTLVDLQLKFALQERFDRDGITAFYGVMSAVVGTGTLVLQFWASRVLFPRMGVSFAALVQAGTLAMGAGLVAVVGGIFGLAGLQALDDILQFSLQKPVEQVSLLPFPGNRKSAALATLQGVLRPVSKAAAGALALIFAGTQGVLPLLTVAAAMLAFVAYTRHRPRYLAALEGALARQAVDFHVDAPLVVDKGALAVIDRALEDHDPTVVVFALSLLEQLPEADAVGRALPLLTHDTPEVRAEAARVLGRMETPDVDAVQEALSRRLDGEDSPFVLAALLEAAGRVGGGDPARWLRFLEHPDAGVRSQALAALGRQGWPGLTRRLDDELTSPDAGRRASACTAVGLLGSETHLPAVARLVEDPGCRPAALAALSALGSAAVPTLADLLRRRAVPLPLRRSTVTALAAVGTNAARNALLDVVHEPAIGPAALTSLYRMRREGNLEAVDLERLRPLLDAEIRTGLRYALAASALRDEAEGDEAPRVERLRFAADELEGLRHRSVYRVMRILALGHDPQRLAAVEAGLTGQDEADRSNALELLEGTLSPPIASVVMPFAEATSEGFAPDRVAGLLDDAAELLAEPLEKLTEEEDWWPRSLALHALGRDDLITVPGRDPGTPQEESTMIPLIEKVMILKGSQLFRDFPGGDLAGIASLAREVHLGADEAVFHQGEEGDAFYMVVKGSVRIMRGSTELAVLGPREGFGEMAILDQETRSATATAAEPTTLLRIDRHDFDRLIEQNPAVARGIYRVLTRRLRNTLAQVAAG